MSKLNWMTLKLQYDDSTPSRTLKPLPQLDVPHLPWAGAVLSIWMGPAQSLPLNVTRVEMEFNEYGSFIEGRAYVVEEEV